ncbi:hypothetical protein, partial [Mogibacterium kristiansenii]|uniref:hypothetical protein n=1 Tax=Mogibacterium kristiansenii TaxID=2606708 RepID=UPI00197D4E82
TIHFHQMKKTAQLFCKSNFLSGFANLKSSAAITKAELTFSIQEPSSCYVNRVRNLFCLPSSSIFTSLVVQKCAQ